MARDKAKTMVLAKEWDMPESQVLAAVVVCETISSIEGALS